MQRRSTLLGLAPSSTWRSRFAPWFATFAVMALASTSACTGMLSDPERNGTSGDGDGDGDGDGPENPDGTTGPQGLDPGRVTLRRLNRNEYDNTVRDLLGTTQTPARDFPADDTGYGFDNIADVLSISPVQLELYERAAEALAIEALIVPTAAETARQEAETLDGAVGGATDEGWILSSSGELAATFDFPTTGDYLIRVRAEQQAAGPDDAQMSIRVAGQDVSTVTVADSQVFEVQATVNQGTQVVSVAFLNDFYDEVAGEDRNLVVDWLEVEGPLGPAGDNPIRERIVTCDLAEGEPCLTTILDDFASRAFRRPAEPDELEALLGLVDLAEAQGDSVDRGLELALRAVLTSPHFIFRVEIDPDPTSEEPHPLTDWEVATRLSYFIWSSMPDDALFDAAAAGSLSDPEALRAQIARMLDDERSEALVENFAGQWLWVRNLAAHTPDYAAFPDWDEELRSAMQEETRQFFRELLRGEQPLGSILRADFAYLNDRLAEHYGLPLPGSDDPVRVELDGLRGGLLGQGSILTVTSFATRTSPVKRGKWVLEQLLCDAPPPPPAGVEGFTEQPNPTASLRERMEAHRANPECAACHDILDPIGFGLESFDGVGAWRTEDTGGFPIDSSGEMPDGNTFADTAGLVEVLAADARLSQCIAEKLFVYALGRGPRSADDDYLDALAEVGADPQATLPDLLAAVVTTEPFRTRRGEPAEGEDQ